MADGTDGTDLRVPVVCTLCETTTRVSLEDAAATIDRHNDQLHGGEPVAEIDPVLRDEIADLAAADLRDAE